MGEIAAGSFPDTAARVAYSLVADARKKIQVCGSFKPISQDGLD